MKKYLILNGPNLNLLGTREPEVYGKMTFDEVKRHTEKFLEGYDIELDWFQSNIEGELIDKIQGCQGNYDALIINPAAYSHTSVAIYDALKTLNMPIIETHLTNVYERESFRQTMLTGKAASTIMCGLGKDAYAIAALSDYLTKT